jgi:YHS domain-containing protein
MCPGVVSDWPSKCPVCNMTLVRRKKGEATPLPDGVLARMQFSPYRVQLAGIRTSPVTYSPLTREVVLAGLVEPAGDVPEESAGPPRVRLRATVFENDMALVTPGRAAEVTAPAYPDRVFVGRVRQSGRQLTLRTRGLPVSVEVDNPGQELRPGMYVTARVRAPAADDAEVARAWREEWRDRTLLDTLAHALAGPGPVGGVEPLLRLAGQQALLRRGLVLAVPESAVVDTGTRKVVYVERMPGMFDGVEVVLGRRCGDAYPVLRGLDAGDQVATAGAFLIDAETRLNPGVAATYFGAGRASGAAPASTPTPTPSPTDDQTLSERQKVCPVTGQPLGSMGPPFKVVFQGQTVFLCCEGCEAALRKNPEKYLAKLRGK